MTELGARDRATGRWSISLLAFLTFIAIESLIVPRVAAADPVVVFLDRARILQLPDRAATIVVGNPLIADLSIQPGGLAIVTGKGYGATNFVVLDRHGVVLAEHTVEVTGPTDQTVIVYRGIERETYSCTPDCSRRITLGDDPDFFDKTLTQSTNRNTQAASAGGLAAGR